MLEPSAGWVLGMATSPPSYRVVPKNGIWYVLMIVKEFTNPFFIYNHEFLSNRTRQLVTAQLWWFNSFCKNIKNC
jgi:hypothetical protein